MKQMYLLFFILIPLFVEAKYDVTPACYKDLEHNFFDPNITKVAFSLYQVNQGSWDAILNDIKRRTKGIHERIWAKGRKLKHNPLDNKYNQDEAAVLLKNELFEIFDKACQENFVTSKANIQDMFNYIEYRQASTIHKCFGRNTFLKPAEEKE